MTEHTATVRSSGGNRAAAASVSIGLSVLFLALLVLLHFLEPEFDPAWRMISEYELGAFGWLMALAFFCWSGSVLALVVTIWPSVRTLAGRIGRWWLVLIGIALIGAGAFRTDPIIQTARSTAGVLHIVSGAIVILTFPIAASLIARSLASRDAWAPARRSLLWATVLVWIGLLAFFASIIISNLVNPSAGRVGPAVLLGWPNRFMVLTYHLWLIVVARRARLIAQRR